MILQAFMAVVFREHIKATGVRKTYYGIDVTMSMVHGPCVSIRNNTDDKLIKMSLQGVRWTNAAEYTSLIQSALSHSVLEL